MTAWTKLVTTEGAVPSQGGPNLIREGAMSNVSTFRIRPKAAPPPQRPAEAECRTPSFKQNLGCIAVGALVLLVCIPMTTPKGGRAQTATSILVVSIIALIYSVVATGKKATEQEKLSRIASDRRKALYEADQRREEQAALDMAQKLTVLYHDQQGNVTSLRDILSHGDAAIDQAQQLFTERAYTPFWDDIEEAVKQLRRFNDRVRLIDASAKQY